MRKYILIIILASVSIVSAQTDIPGGDVSGTWTTEGSPYLVHDHITLDWDSTLIIEPGVEVIFQENCLFRVIGHLEAIGTEIDSIFFNGSPGWFGIWFYNAFDNGHLAYCTISGGQGVIGTGISCYYSNPIITHCRINGNHGL